MLINCLKLTVRRIEKCKKNINFLYFIIDIICISLFIKKIKILINNFLLLNKNIKKEIQSLNLNYF